MFTRLKQKIDQYSVISFDIFDTLIMRTYNNPVDVFKHIEIGKNRPDFQKERQKAEQIAREKYYSEHKHEVTIDEIYDCIPEKYKDLKEAEIAQELRNCYRDEYMFEIFNYAKNAGKRIVIASDMYLPKEVVEKILENAGYSGYEKLFLSSDSLRSKAIGLIFEDIITHIGGDKNQILHIGDNHHSDRDMAKKNGINCYLYKTGKAINISKDTGYFSSIDSGIEDISCSILKGLTIKRAFQINDLWEDFGYKYAGLMVVGYCEWLYKEFKQKNIEKVFFAARDSYIPFHIFKEKYPEIKSQYFYASRRAYLFSGCKKISDIMPHLVEMVDDGVSFDEYWESLRIDDADLKKVFFTEFSSNSLITLSKKDELRAFFSKNEAIFLEYGKKERMNVMQYFNKIGLSGKNNAIVDIGWRGTIQASILNTFKLGEQEIDVFGYYLATHPLLFDISLKPWLLDENKPDERASIINPVLGIFELILSAPHLGCVKITLDNNDPTPVFQIETPEETIRMDSTRKIYQGVMSFLKDFETITQNLPVKIQENAALAPFIDFYKNLHIDMQREFEKIKFVTGVGDSKKFQSLCPSFSTAESIGVVYTWPGETQSGEAEFLYRLLNIDLGNKTPNIIPISRDGFILNSKFDKTAVSIRENDFKFIISFHYDDNVKMLDNFYYHALWNPPEITLQYNHYKDLLKQITSNDDFLIYDDGGMKNHLQCMLIDNPRDLEKASFLTASLPKNASKKTDLSNPKIFYCGINWEKMLGITPRHEGLFNLLDKSGSIKIFGPQSTWKGYINYYGKIPFDGFSLLEEINHCGVVLALSSNFHYRAGAATNRVYEGCAAGAVIITDTNRFIQKHFGDSVLYIDFDKNNPQNMFKQISAHMKWIKENQNDARLLAEKSQNIFLEKFTLEKQILDVINNHDNRKAAVAKALYAQNNNSVTLVISYIDDLEMNPSLERRIKNILMNLDKQYDKNIIVVFACNENIIDDIYDFLETLNIDVKLHLVPFKIYDAFGNKLMTRGQMLCEITDKFSHDYFMILSGSEVFFKDHIATLRRTLEDTPQAVISHSGMFWDSNDTNRYKWLHTYFHKQNIYANQYFENCCNPSGSFLMRAAVRSYLTDFMLPYLDGAEVPALLSLSVFKHEQTVEYSKRITMCQSEARMYHFPLALDYIFQLHFVRGLVQYNYERWQSTVVYSGGEFNSHHHSAVTTYKDAHLEKLLIMKLYINIFLLRLRRLFAFSSTKRKEIKIKKKMYKNILKHKKQFRKHTNVL